MTFTRKAGLCRDEKIRVRKKNEIDKAKQSQNKVEIK